MEAEMSTCMFVRPFAVGWSNGVERRGLGKGLKTSILTLLWGPANVRGGPELYTIRLARKLWGILTEKSGSREKQMGLRDISEVGLIGFNDQLNVRHENKKE